MFQTSIVTASPALSNEASRVEMAAQLLLHSESQYAIPFRHGPPRHLLHSSVLTTSAQFQTNVAFIVALTHRISILLQSSNATSSHMKRSALYYS